MGTMGIYKPLYVWCSPASIPQIVAHIQDYLVKNPIVSTETVAEIVVQSLQEHPELINGSVIPITEDSAQTIKEYIDALPLLDGYTKAETDALLLLKQNLLIWDQTPTAGSSNPVTSEGIKAAISATAAALADLISTKADIASVYTKSVMDTLLIQKADVATTYSKNAVDALLDTKVDINDTYTKADIDLMKQVDKANTAIVSSTDGTAPLNIAAGQYVYLNDILYMATQAILENDPLVPGTNIVLTPKGVANNIGDGLQSLARTVGEQSDQIANLENGIAYIENGDIATVKTYTQGEWIIWKGSLYTVNSGGLPLNEPITGHVTSAPAGGCINSLNDDLTDIKDNIGSSKLSKILYFAQTLQTDTSSQSDLSNIALTAWQKAGAVSNSLEFVLQDSTGVVRQCIVFRRGSGGIVIMLDQTGTFRFITIENSAVTSNKSVMLS